MAPSRNPNRESSIYQGKDGFWHGRVTVGTKDDGSSDRRHVMSKTKGVVVKKVRALEKLRNEARVPQAGRSWTVERWLRHWLEEIARPSIRDSSYQAYRTAVEKHLVPVIGGQRLDRLEPEHLERLYRGMLEAGARAGTAHQVHRTVRTALGEAHRRGHLPRNPAQLVRPPRVRSDLVEPFTVEEVHRLLATAKTSRNGTRWAIALALGLRQGEALALRWTDIDLDSATLRVRATRLRPVYGHGCIKAGGGTCGKTPGFCPQKTRLNPEIGATKSAAGNRIVGLPGELVALLREHQAAQMSERRRAASTWTEGDWVFASPTGAPLSSNSDYYEWRSLLERAGVRRARLHDARHTAATVLLVLGVPERTVMSVMGWSSTSMAARYQHVTDPIRREVATRVDALLFVTGPDETAPDDSE